MRRQVLTVYRMGLGLGLGYASVSYLREGTDAQCGDGEAQARAQVREDLVGVIGEENATPSG